MICRTIAGKISISENYDFYLVNFTFRANIVVRGQNLRHINLTKCRASSEISKIPLNQLLRLHAIQEYNLSDFLISIAYYCKNLKSINVGSVVTEEAISTFLKLRKCTLIQFSLLENVYGNDWYTYLQLCENLSHLEIACADEINSDGISAISNLTHLQILKLNFVHGVTDSTLISRDFAKLFLKLTKLRHLELNSFDLLNFYIIKVIASTCPHIEILSFNWCLRIDKKCLRMIMKNCTNIVKLSLRGCFDFDIETINELLINMKKLRYLDLYRCKSIQDSELEALDRKYCFNELTIVTPYGEEIK